MADWIILGALACTGVIVFVVAFLALITRFYTKAQPNKAFVRTGGYGTTASKTEPLVVKDGGAWVIRAFHEIRWVDLRTMGIEIERIGENALLTSDPQYADIRAIFYIKVGEAKEDIIAAARTVGGDEVDSVSVRQLVESKLDGALRDIAASFNLMTLHAKREEFIEKVQIRVKNDLKENGLILESVSILNLKAAEQGTFSTNDVFGAQVARANAEVIEEARRRQNEIEREAEVEIKRRDDSAEKEKIDLQRDLAFARAKQEREVRMQQAQEKSTADKAVYEQEQAAEEARLIKEEAVSLAEERKQQAILIQQERNQQQFEVAEIERQQAQAVAEQTKQAAIVREQAKRESAEKERLEIVAQREQAAQEVKTVEELAQAEREAKRVMIDRRNEVEIAAFKKIKDAEAEATALKEIAEAELEAATKKAETKRTEAQAQSDAEKTLAAAERARASADGLAEADVIKAKSEAKLAEADVTRAAGLAEAEVVRAKAEAAQAEAEVIKVKGLAEAESIKAKGLAEAEGEMAKAEALAAHDSVQQRLEMERLRLEAQVQIGVARAKAMGEAMAQMQIKMFGTPDAVDNILRLMSYADGAEDLINSLPKPVQHLGQQMMERVTGQPNGHANGTSISLAEVQTLLPELVTLVGRTLTTDNLDKLTLTEVVAQLEAQAAEADKPLVSRARQVLDGLPFLGQQTVGSLVGFKVEE